MRMWLYQLVGDKRYIEKTVANGLLIPLEATTTSDGSFDAVMLDDTSVIEPTFVLSRHHYWKRCNYIWSEDTLRYYYVTDVTLSQNKVYVKCHVDVLNTFRTKLFNKTVILKRASKWNSVLEKPFNYNMYLNDDKFKAYAQVCNRFIKFPENQGFDINKGEFVMCVVGNSDNENAQEGGDK